MNMEYAPDNVIATFPFIQKNELYKTVKPYGADFSTEAVPRSNLKMHKVDGVSITDMRGLEKKFTFDEDGFKVLKFKPSLPYDGFANQAKVEEIYCEELGLFLVEHFQASAIQIFETQVQNTSFSL